MTNATEVLSVAKEQIVASIARIDYALDHRALNTESLRRNLVAARDAIETLQHEGLPPRESKKGQMSGDRVRIVIPERYLNIPAVQRAMQGAFGLTSEEVRCLPRSKDRYANDGLEVICRPSQFARFVILRNEYGGNNSIKDLQPELFVPAISAQPLDVSKRRNEFKAPPKEY